MPIPPGGSAFDAALEALKAQQAGGAVDFFGIAQRFGVAVNDLIAAMDTLVRAEGRAAQDVERLHTRAYLAQTPEGQARTAEAAGYRAQLQESRAAAAARTPQALSRAAEREDREAARERRSAARIGEQEESRAERDYQRAARERRAAERATPEYRSRAAAESLAAQAAYARTPEGRESLAAQARGRAELAAARREADTRTPQALAREAERERQEAVFGRSRYGPAVALGALASSGMLTGRYAALAGGAAGVLGGVAMGGIPGVALGVASVARAVAAAHEDVVSAASQANPIMGATVAASEQRAEIARGATPEAQLAARQKAIYEQAKARFYDARGFGASAAAYHEMMTAGGKYAATGELPAWYKEEVRLPVEGAMVSDPRQFWERASLAGAQGGELSADSLREQLKLMRGQHQLLEEIKDTNLDAVVSKWRR